MSYIKKTGWLVLGLIGYFTAFSQTKPIYQDATKPVEERIEDALSRMTLEEKVTAVLDNHGIFYEQSEVWIEEEKLYEVAFEFAMPV